MNSITEISQIDLAPVSLASSSNGRTSGKNWKATKTATDGVKSKSWNDRMEKTKKEHAIKKLQAEMREEKQAELTRKREVTLERKKAAEERRRIEEEKAKVTFMINTLAIHANLRSQMGQRKAARLRRKAGRSKKING
ncbi:hypothetical protein HWV62_6477 [Athelia sp. TMB]|nr:hypothetical protein HWV62_6477 [Athelia sp. TMB]